jgi:hypothetical protein
LRVQSWHPFPTISTFTRHNNKQPQQATTSNNKATSNNKQQQATTNNKQQQGIICLCFDENSHTRAWLPDCARAPPCPQMRKVSHLSKLKLVPPKIE